jgi:hypothetical protein
MCATRVIRKQLKELSKDCLPFDYSLKFVRETIDADNPDCVSAKEFDTFDSINDGVFLDIAINRENCNNRSLMFDYRHQIYLKFPTDYPFKPPNIRLEDPLIHPLIHSDRYGNYTKINTCDFSPFMSVSQLIINIYLIVWEAINDSRNQDAIDHWNKSESL